MSALRWLVALSLAAPPSVGVQVTHPDVLSAATGTKTEQKDVSGRTELRSDDYASIQEALDALSTGDRLILAEGRHFLGEAGKLTLNGKQDVEIVGEGSGATLDATIDLSGGWEPHGDCGILKRALPRYVWQLFVDDTAQPLARFPNAGPAFSDLAFDDSSWRFVNTDLTEYVSGKSGRVVDGDECSASGGTLAEQGVSFNGCVAIANVGHWSTETGIVYDHEAGTDTFKHELVGWIGDGYFFINSKAKYYLEGCMAALDTPGEWAIDRENRVIYHMPENGMTSEAFNKLSVRGKTLDTLLEVVNSERVNIENVHFFGASFRVTQSKEVELRRGDLQYPSFSRRALGEATQASGSSIQSSTGTRLVDLTFRETDGSALAIQNSPNTLVENCHFERIDYSAVGPVTNGISCKKSPGTIIRQNTLDTGGASVAIGASSTSMAVELNLITNWGKLQIDGGVIQAQTMGQDGLLIHQNWALNTRCIGFRLDAPHSGSRSRDFGTNSTVVQNVAFNTRTGLIIKGDEHRVTDNLVISAWDNINQINILEDWHGSEPSYNTESVIERNIADTIGGRSSIRTGPDYLPETVGESNWNGYYQESRLTDLLMGPQYFDFRDRPGAGGGEFTGLFQHGEPYFVPGRRLSKKTSQPVPNDGAKGVRGPVSLFWRHALREEGSEEISYTVWLDGESLGSTTENTFEVSRALEPGSSHTWRVDVGGAPAAGDTWTFELLGGAASAGGSEARCDSEGLTAALKELADLVKSGALWRDDVACQSAAVKQLYERSPSLQGLERCTSWQCNLERLESEPGRCTDAEIYRASKEALDQAWLLRIAFMLPRCWSDTDALESKKCPAEAAPGQHCQDLPSGVGKTVWITCEENALLADVNAIRTGLQAEGWANWDDCDGELEAAWLKSIVYSRGICSEKQLNDAVLVLYGGEPQEFLSFILTNLPKKCPPVKVNCAGAWATCNSDCKEVYRVAVPASNGGSACEASPGDERACSAGEGGCPPPEEDSNSNSDSDSSCNASILLADVESIEAGLQAVGWSKWRECGNPLGEAYFSTKIYQLGVCSQAELDAAVLVVRGEPFKFFSTILARLPEKCAAKEEQGQEEWFTTPADPPTPTPPDASAPTPSLPEDCADPCMAASNRKGCVAIDGCKWNKKDTVCRPHGVQAGCACYTEPLTGSIQDARCQSVDDRLICKAKGCQWVKDAATRKPTCLNLGIKCQLLDRETCCRAAGCKFKKTKKKEKCKGKFKGWN